MGGRVPQAILCNQMCLDSYDSARAQFVVRRALKTVNVMLRAGKNCNLVQQTRQIIQFD